MENNPANHVLAAASQSSILRDLTKAEKICWYTICARETVYAYGLPLAETLPFFLEK